MIDCGGPEARVLALDLAPRAGVAARARRPGVRPRRGSEERKRARREFRRPPRARGGAVKRRRRGGAPRLPLRGLGARGGERGGGNPDADGVEACRLLAAGSAGAKPREAAI